MRRGRPLDDFLVTPAKMLPTRVEPGLHADTNGQLIGNIAYPIRKKHNLGSNAKGLLAATKKSPGGGRGANRTVAELARPPNKIYNLNEQLRTVQRVFPRPESCLYSIAI